MTRATLLLGLLLALGGCRASEPECARLLEHFVDVEGDVDVAGHFQQMTPKLREAVAREKRAFAEELRPSFMERCRAELSSAEVSCAVQATDEAGLDRCEHR
jgi:hypothetical protein